jgi:hypothetical protein
MILKLKIGKMISGKKMIDNLLALVLSALLVASVSLDNFVSLDSFASLDGFVSLDSFAFLDSFASLDNFVSLGSFASLGNASHAVNLHCCKVLKKGLSGFFFLSHHFKLQYPFSIQLSFTPPSRSNVYNPYLLGIIILTHTHALNTSFPSFDSSLREGLFLCPKLLDVLPRILLANGEPVIEESRRLGHSKLSVTLDIYGHAIPHHDQKIADRIAGPYGI